MRLALPVGKIQAKQESQQYIPEGLKKCYYGCMNLKIIIFVP